MLIIGRPKNTEDYVGVDSDTSVTLHLNGFLPKYKYELYYYEKTKELIDFMRNKNLIERRMK